MSFHCQEYGTRQLGLKLFHDPREDGAGGFLVAGASPETGDERLMGFDGKSWRDGLAGGPGHAARLARRRRHALGSERRPHLHPCR